MSKTLKQTRSEFSKKYPSSSKIIRMLLRGKNTNAIVTKLDVSPNTVRTVKGNLTRGFYLPFVQMAEGQISGTCNY